MYFAYYPEICGRILHMYMRKKRTEYYREVCIHILCSICARTDLCKTIIRRIMCNRILHRNM